MQFLRITSVFQYLYYFLLQIMFILKIHPAIHISLGELKNLTRYTNYLPFSSLIFVNSQCTYSKPENDFRPVRFLLYSNLVVVCFVGCVCFKLSWDLLCVCVCFSYWNIAVWYPVIVACCLSKLSADYSWWAGIFCCKNLKSSECLKKWIKLCATLNPSGALKVV